MYQQVSVVLAFLLLTGSEKAPKWGGLQWFEFHAEFWSVNASNCSCPRLIEEAEGQTEVEPSGSTGPEERGFVIWNHGNKYNHSTARQLNIILLRDTNESEHRPQNILNNIHK